jgi:hypothetical protein
MDALIPLFVLGYTLFSWFLLGWMLLDMKQRQRRRRRWAVLWFIPGPLMVIPWLIARRRSPVVERVRWFGKLAQLGLAFLLIVASWSLVGLNGAMGCGVARIEGRAMSPTLHDQDAPCWSTSWSFASWNRAQARS